MSVRTTWFQPIAILLNFCWRCYFFMEKHHISYGKSPCRLWKNLVLPSALVRGLAYVQNCMLTSCSSPRFGFFKKVLSLCPYHCLLQTVAFGPSGPLITQSLSWCIPSYLIILCTIFSNLMEVLHIWLYDLILRFIVTFSHFTSSDYSSSNQ